MIEPVPQGSEQAAARWFRALALRLVHRVRRCSILRPPGNSLRLEVRNRCLISAPAFSPASRATRTRSRSSMATCASPMRNGTGASPRWSRASTGSACSPAITRHRAAEPLAGRDHPLGLPVRRHHHHAGELARDRRRARLSASRMPRPRRSSTRRSRPRRCGVGRGRASVPRIAVGAARRRSPFETLVETRRAGRAAARRRRGLVGDALHVRHDRASRRACRAASAPSAPPRSRMWRRTCTATASARSA